MIYGLELVKTDLRASEPTRSPYTKNKNPIELKVIFLEIVYLDLYSDKVWGFSIFSFCTPPGDIYGRPLVRASTEGDWTLNLSCIRQILPWCFAYDAINYARYMSVYYSDMTSLQKEHPEVHEFMKTDGFSVQMSSNKTCGRIPVDQTVEETVNKYTQTTGGTKGFSLKSSAVQRYYMTAEFRSLFLPNLGTMVGYAQGNNDHIDLQQPRIAKDEQEVKAIIMVDLIESNWTNPFSSYQPLLSISTGATASPEIEHDLSRAYLVGETAYQQFKKERLELEKPPVKFHHALTKQKLKTYSDRQYSVLILICSHE